MHKKCNERYMTKEQLGMKAMHLQRKLKNAGEREKRLQERFEKELMNMDIDDTNDLQRMTSSNASDDNIPPDMKIMWEQQQKILQTKSKNGYRWHPK